LRGSFGEVSHAMKAYSIPGIPRFESVMITDEMDRHYKAMESSFTISLRILLCLINNSQLDIVNVVRKLLKCLGSTSFFWIMTFHSARNNSLGLWSTQQFSMSLRQNNF
jgi:hypothetical protein